MFYLREELQWRLAYPYARLLKRWNGQVANTCGTRRICMCEQIVVMRSLSVSGN